MYIEVNTTWKTVGNGGGGSTASGTGTAFNTDTKQIEQWTGSRNLAVLDPPPPDAHLVVGAFLWFDCDVNYTATKYFYAGGTDVRIETEVNSVNYCGYQVALSCDLGTLTVQQKAVGSRTTLTAQYSGLSNGQAYYALDGGVEQTSPVFTGVLPGSHKLQVRDDGLAGCTASLDVEVTAPAGPVVVAPTVPAGASQGIDFVQQPLWFQVATAPAGARVELELYAESSHGADDFALVLTLRQLADAAGHVNFRLDTLLLPLLSPFVPPVAGPLVSQRCTTNLVNYFVRTATYDATGAATRAQGPLRTALRGGLPAEWQDTNYFRLRELRFALPPCLSWQPAGPGTYAAEAVKAVTLVQPEWLFWLSTVDVPVLRVARTYDNGPGTAALVEYEDLPAAPARGWLRQLLAIPLAPAHADYQRVMVQVEAAGGLALSQPAWYTFVEETPRTRYLLFTNSLGTTDTLRCEGRLDVTLEASTQQAERPARPGAPVPAADRQVSDLSASRKLKLATGWLEPEELAWLQDLVLSREVWLAQAEQLRPLDWGKRTLAPYSDEPGLRGLLLECDYAYSPTAYAPGVY
ncbi:hypothetical protein [Hymenobacter cheonanensis]|uniref:hypothetical protein n=1 Tax=Hymenobacter sp. CA2-7 TaxID=3063993 RepID=UPI00271297BF|nr:hypothetical protein [Hymenobacter sp. CA2-7]MDO7885338.1 hypothetical protein [Hymenobacter sp. CA2-7]